MCATCVFAAALAVFTRSLALAAHHHIVAAVGTAARATALAAGLAALAAHHVGSTGVGIGRVIAGGTGHGILDVFKETTHHVVAACGAAAVGTARCASSILARVHLIHWSTKINACAFQKSETMLFLCSAVKNANPFL